MGAIESISGDKFSKYTARYLYFVRERFFFFSISSV